MATRRERVILDLEDNFTAGVARAAAVTQLLDKSLDHLSGSAVTSSRDLDKTTASTKRFGDSSGKAGPQIDKFSGRLRLLTDAAVTLGPALIPLGASTIPVLTGAMAALGAAAGGIGATVLAFQGMGDALKAINKAELDPTAENLEEMRRVLTELGPAGADFARYLNDLQPAVDALQASAREGLFPGLQEGIDDLLSRGPQVQGIISELATGMGNLATDAGESLSSDAWTPFFDYVEHTARPTLEAFGHAAGNVALGIANMLVALDPLTQDFTTGLVDVTERFAEWSANLGENGDFQQFVNYIRESGPQAVAFLVALAQAFAGLIQAAGPLGQAVLPALTALAQAFAAIASSDIGPVLYTAVAAMIAFNRAAALTSKASALLTSSFGPWGLAVGASVGLVMEFKSSYDELRDSIEGVDSAVASGSIPRLEGELASAREQLKGINDDLDNKSLGEKLLGPFAGLTDIKPVVGEVTGATDDLKDSIANGEQALFNLRNNIPTLLDPLRGLRAGLEEVTSAEQEQADATYESIAAMRAKRSEVLRGLNAELNYQAAIDDANKSIKENGRNFDVTTEKGRANRQALYGLADGWNRQTDAAKNAKGSLEAARQNFVKTAETMGATAAQAKRLADRLFEIPTKRPIDVTLDTHGATADLVALKARMDSLHDKTLNVYTNVHPMGGQAPGSATNADGGTIPGPRRPYGDKMLYMLAPGEEVISNRYGQADRHRGLLKAINARRAADGDTVGGIGPKSQLYGIGSPWLSIAELAERISHLTLRQLKTLGDDIDGLSKKNLAELAKALDAAAEAAKKDVDAAKKRRDAAIGRRDAISGGIQEGLTSDIWATSEGSSNVWAAGASAGGVMDPTGALKAQTDRAKRLVAALNTLKQKGVTGPALLEIIGTGNVERAEMMAALPIADLAGFSSAFGEAQSALAAAGLAGGNAIEGQNVASTQRQLSEQLKELREIKQAIKAADDHNDKGHDRNAEFVTAGVNGAAASGHRRGHKGGRR